MYGVARTARDSDHVQRRRNQCNTFRRSSSIRLLILTIRIFTNAYQPIMERDPLLHPYYTINSRQNIFLNEMERAILVEHSVIIPIRTVVSSRASFVAVDAVTCVPVYTFIMVPRVRYMYMLYTCQIHVPLGVRAYMYVYNLPDSFRDFEISVRGKSVFARAAANPVTNSRLTVDRVKTVSISCAALLIRESKTMIHESITIRENIFFLFRYKFLTSGLFNIRYD